MPAVSEHFGAKPFPIEVPKNVNANKRRGKAMFMETRAELDPELIARVSDDEAFRALLLENLKEAIQQATGIAIPEDFII